MLFLLGCVLPYLAVAMFLIGMALRTWNWLRKPVPFQLTLFPAQHGVVSQAAAVAKELLLFQGLYRGDRRLWCWAWLMHVALAAIILGHVVGIAFVSRQFTYLGASPATSKALSLTFGVIFGLLFVLSVLALCYRRTTIPEVKRLSDPADYFDLALLLAIAVTGLHMRLTTPEVDPVAVRTYLWGLLTFRPVAIPTAWIFVSHFALVNVLLMYFPFSKLVHLTGGVVSRALLVQSAPRYPTPPGVTQDARVLR
jgi:nitrate reductase gamma subunit